MAILIFRTFPLASCKNGCQNRIQRRKLPRIGSTRGLEDGFCLIWPPLRRDLCAQTFEFRRMRSETLRSDVCAQNSALRLWPSDFYQPSNLDNQPSRLDKILSGFEPQVGLATLSLPDSNPAPSTYIEWSLRHCNFEFKN